MMGNRKRELEAMVTRERERAERAEQKLEGLETVQAQQIAQLQDADETILRLHEELDRLKNPAAFNPPDNDMFVVVTEASKTPTSKVIKHAWGPYATRTKAQASAQRFQRNAKDEGHITKTSVLKIIST